MAVNKHTTRRKKRGGARGIIASAVSLCVLAVLALLLVPGGPGPGIDGIGRLFSGAGRGELSGELYFSQGLSEVFADLGDGVAAAGEFGLQVLGDNGMELYREQLHLSNPAVDAAGGRALIYDLGGKVLRVIDSGGALNSLEAKEPIVSATINEKGWYCVSTQASGGYKSVVTVYNDKGAERYRVEIASGYVLDARLDRDNKNLAVLSITDTGGRVSFYSRDSEDVLEKYDRAGDVILALNWLPDGRVIAVTKAAALIIDKSGQGSVIYDYSGKYLGGFCLTGGDFITIYLLDYGVGNEGRLITLGRDGSVLAELGTVGENRAMSVSGGMLAVLWDGYVALYDSLLGETSFESEGKAFSGILALSGGKALATGSRVSRVLETL